MPKINNTVYAARGQLAFVHGTVGDTVSVQKGKRVRKGEMGGRERKDKRGESGKITGNLSLEEGTHARSMYAIVYASRAPTYRKRTFSIHPTRRDGRGACIHTTHTCQNSIYINIKLNRKKPGYFGIPRII